MAQRNTAAVRVLYDLIIVPDAHLAQHAKVQHLKLQNSRSVRVCIHGNIDKYRMYTMEYLHSSICDCAFALADEV